MVEAEGIPPTASTASVGLGINYAAEWVYAYSGDVTLAADLNNPTTMLEFTTGSGIIIGKIGWGSDTVGGNDTRVNISMNGERIFICRYAAGQYESNDQPLNVVIPPFTTVLVAIGAEVSVTGTAILTGRVYDA